MSAAGASRRLLVVDDEQEIRTLLARLLKRLPQPPTEIDTAASAEEALARLEERRYTLLLTDFNMGGRDGVDLLATASERWPTMLRTLMTGYTDEQIYVDAKQKGGAAAVIRKPWNNKDLLQLLSTLMDQPPGEP